MRETDVNEDASIPLSVKSSTGAGSVHTGLALKQPISVYESTNRTSSVLKSYPYGHLLKYRTYSDEWYEATVYIKGKPQTGYIHTSDVGKKNEAKSVKGIALKKTTSVYSEKTKKSTILRSYHQGHILKYRAYDKDWYSATVFIKGKAHTGFIHVRDVETATAKGVVLQGVSTNKPTRVYQKASTSSNALKSYPYGQILKYKEFTSNWYEATVYIKGKAQTGYIHKKHVGSLQTVLSGYAQKNQTNVYKNTSNSSGVLKSYPIGATLKYRPHNKSWFVATVYIIGKKHTGYIHKNDVGLNEPSLKGYGKRSTTQIYSKASRNSKIIKGYQKGSRLKYKPHNKNWYKATVSVNGKWTTGYINKSDISVKKPTLRTVDRLKSVNKNNQLILVTSKGFSTNKAKIQTFE